MAADYHSKPLLSCRVPAGSLDWARGEAQRRGQPFGDFMDSLITGERERVANQRPAHALNCKCMTCKPPEEGK